ncbi:D-alanyl-D-alanine carboxypeptidase/D-alanyl-D-alanine-endopeptidase [Fimbriimonas ginsengisoli]|uniref:Peptidase S13, D-Ala-D-Ala carboxypeptidase C n=1 Tax=Fimbriimonas ginsengisoli Gsoil 348 TaxID=661478 RepID=A0A068NWJ3_FIMGI|nr:D-alanyl-D-alanine carboxypeptidase [Fimbriimonas ginsengisoli]AIE87821.1 peptidase S13, D-Ala-D-Ala carboxypeptidase C [Fimbriimonas ginsengisoli Gsoil 348]
MLALLVALQTQDFGRILDDPKLDGSIAAVVVADRDGKILFERNSRTHVMPASNMKLLSNSFALYQLGPDRKGETRFWKEPTRTVVESTGDPMLTHDQLVEARNRLRLDRRLPVYLHEEYAPGWGENWEYGDLPNKYAAPVCAFNVDRGSFEIWSQGGKPQFRPEAYGTRVVPAALPKGTTTRYDPFTRTVYATNAAFTKDQRVDTLSLPHPDEAAASLLGSRMVPTDEVPRRAPDLVIAGPKIIDVVGACLPPSDNQLAEQLLMLGARTEGPLGLDAYATARTRLTNFLTRIVGIDPADVKVDDGSGLSRHNYVTARAIVKLLAWSDHQPTALQWRAALAHAGKGTLASRLKGIEFTGKTGSLDLVAALSGYVQTRNGETRIVSIIFNQFGCSPAEARGIADRIVAAASD